MRRLIALESLCNLSRSRRRRTIGLNSSPQIGGVRLTGQFCDWNVDEIRIAEITCAIDECAAHRLGDIMHVGSGVVAKGFEIISLENVQHLDKCDAAGSRRRHRDYLVTAIRPANRCPLLRFVGRQILQRDQAAVATHVVDDQAGSLAAVESGAALIPYARQRLTQIPEYDALAGRVRLSIPGVSCETRGMGLELIAH